MFRVTKEIHFCYGHRLLNYAGKCRHLHGHNGTAVIALEVGDVSRFASAQRLASYAGTTPRVHASGGKVRYGTLRPDVNRYLKWAFAEAANSVALHHATHPDRHVSQLYRRIKGRKGHAKAVGAVARHLAEAAFHVLGKGQAYRDPAAPRHEREGPSPDDREGPSPDDREAPARNNQDASATLS